MKKVSFLLVPLFLFLVVVCGAYFWWMENTKPVSQSHDAVVFIIPKGQTATDVGLSLQKKGLIRSSLAFKVYLQVTGKTKTVQAGEFKISPSLNLEGVVNSLYQGPLEIWVTIPEGLRREEVVEKIISALELKNDQVSSFRIEFLRLTQGKEGMLFPSTYLFPRDVTPAKVADTLNSTFQKKLQEAKANGGTVSDLTQEEVVVMASLIERETKTTQERPIVAGIMVNRLKIGMAMQIDAAVQYGVASQKCQKIGMKCDNWWPILTLDDLEVNTPYNTYKRTGLPPSPIANPGLSSLSAAFHPEETDYLYYIHDPDGQIHYAKTLSEHNANVRKYLGK